MENEFFEEARVKGGALLAGAHQQGPTAAVVSLWPARHCHSQSIWSISKTTSITLSGGLGGF